MTYSDVTLAPEEIEWERTGVWEAARNKREFNPFISERGAEGAVVLFHKAHRAIADKLISRGVTTGREFPGASSWIFAARTYKAARQKAKRIHRERYGEAATVALQRTLDFKYPKRVDTTQDGE